MNRILLIDDDVELGQPLGVYCQRFDLTLEHSVRPSEGLARLQDEAFDAVILDVMMPEMDGLEVCRLLRKFSDIPVLMLTARGDVMDRIIGLEVGADDYLPKPFEPRELIARLQAILRRQRGGPSDTESTSDVLAFAGLRIDVQRRLVWVQETLVECTESEFALLHLLAQEPGRVFSRDEILAQLRGYETELLTRAVDITVSRLRKKLLPLDAIRTARNVGYSLILMPK